MPPDALWQLDLVTAHAVFHLQYNNADDAIAAYNYSLEAIQITNRIEFKDGYGGKLSIVGTSIISSFLARLIDTNSSLQAEYYKLANMELRQKLSGDSWGKLA